MKQQITFERLIGRTVILSGYEQARIIEHSIREDRSGKLYEDICATTTGKDRFYIDLKDNEYTLLDDNVTFVNKKNVIIAILKVKNQTKVGYAIYKDGDDYDLAFGRELAIYRALIDRDITADDFAEIKAEYERDDCAGEDDDEDEYEEYDDDEDEYEDLD